MGDGRPGLATRGSVDVSGGATRDDGRDTCVHTGQPATTASTLVLQSGDLVEDVSQGLVLGPPVQQVVPVVTASDLLLTVHNTETLYLA